MHPENIRKIFSDGIESAKRDYRERHGCSEHTVDQLFSAWAAILSAYDAGMLDAWYPERKGTTNQKVVIDLPAFMDEFVGHMQKESRFLYPNPQHYIFATDALDCLAAAGVRKELLGEQLDRAYDRKDGKR